jgi:hypothetical protein
MTGLDHNRIALVVARSADGDASGQPYEEVATGYFLTGDLVLTARHVGDRPDCVFTVRAEVGGSGEDQWSDATRVWTGAGDVDAMLLRTTRRFGNWETPALQASVESGDWKSSAYARVASDEEHANRKTLPLHGSFGLSRGQGVPELALRTAQNIAPEWEDYWMGISGAPVFSTEPGVGGIIGIITDANRAMLNGLVGLPATRLLNDIRFRSIITPSYLGELPSKPWCLVLTSESSAPELIGQVGDVLAGFRDEEPRVGELHREPIELPVLEAISSIENWAATVDALARADYLIADVTSFEPAVMLLLGIRSVLRRGVSVSVAEGELASHLSTVPFNVQETRVLSYDDDNFYDDLRRAMAEGAANLARDPNYLDLPAYHAVRAPRPESWAEDDAKSLLVLCSFSAEYSRFYWQKLRPIIRGRTGREPQRMLDLRSPRLVGQALYEQTRWSSRCLIDWTEWRPNVFFELGVRLACCQHDALCIIQRHSLTASSGAGSRSSELQQRALLSRLLNPVEYDPTNPGQALRSALESWPSTLPARDDTAPSRSALPQAATFEVAQASFLWQQDAMLTPPHIEQRAGAERILGKDQERLPERLVLFADNEHFDARLTNAVRERWIAAWLYLQHLSTADTCPEDIRAELTRVSRLVQRALDGSSDPRHTKLQRRIRELLRTERARRRTREEGHGDDG